MSEIIEAYKTWPEDIRRKLSLHDLRRMNGWAPRPNPKGWRIDTSAGGPILVYQDCSVIESEQARYVIALIERDGADGWNAIDSAPKDRMIMLWDGEWTVGAWVDDFWDPCIPENPPTHWRELPPPPTSP